MAHCSTTSGFRCVVFHYQDFFVKEIKGVVLFSKAVLLLALVSLPLSSGYTPQVGQVCHLKPKPETSL